MSGAERIAKRFHETYERLAPDHGYATREASAKPWDQIPEQNRELMVAVVEDLLAQGDIELGVLAGAEEPGPRSHFEIFESQDGDYRWRLRAVNGEVVASGEGFESDYNAERACADLVRNAMLARGVVAGGGFSINVERIEE
jgi:uncharacterized protein YegP (UPF0339 family)